MFLLSVIKENIKTSLKSRNFDFLALKELIEHGTIFHKKGSQHEHIILL